MFCKHFPLCSHSVLLQTLSSSPSGQSLSPSQVQCHDGSVMPFRQSWRLSGSIWYVLSIFSKSRGSNIFMYTSYLANYFLKYIVVLYRYDLDTIVKNGMSWIEYCCIRRRIPVIKPPARIKPGPIFKIHSPNVRKSPAIFVIPAILNGGFKIDIPSIIIRLIFLAWKTFSIWLHGKPCALNSC